MKRMEVPKHLLTVTPSVVQHEIAGPIAAVRIRLAQFVRTLTLASDQPANPCSRVVIQLLISFRVFISRIKTLLIVSGPLSHVSAHPTVWPSSCQDDMNRTPKE
jgi:hypothetical protein